MKKTNYYSPSFFQNPGYVDNNTALHLLVLKCLNTTHNPDPNVDALYAVNRINAFIDEVGLAAANSMSLVANDQGMTPIQLLNNALAKSNTTKRSVVKCKELMKALFILMMQKEYKPITEPLRLEAVLENAREGGVLNDKLERNLIIGTYLANVARSKITDSYTHPQFNTYPTELQSTVINAIKILRYILSYSIDPNEDEIQFRSEIISACKVGNCAEYSMMAFAEMHRLNFGIRAEIVRIEKGDHAFLVLGREEKSELNNPSTWGNDAVICDSWAGEVYQAEQLPHRFTNLISFITDDPQFINAITSLNLRFHELACDKYELPEKPINEKVSSELNDACKEGGYIYKLAVARV